MHVYKMIDKGVTSRLSAAAEEENKEKGRWEVFCYVRGGLIKELFIMNCRKVFDVVVVIFTAFEIHQNK